ncbi:MAG: hypothetical protein ACRCYU_00095 [Nocardioides sp.]
MNLFRRSTTPVLDANVGVWGFWRWWQADGAAQLAASLAGGAGQGVDERLTRRVAGIDPKLSWSVADGARARHRLVVSANGDPDLLLVARRWLRKAPEDTETWEYGDRRPPVAQLTGLVLDVDGLSITLDEATVQWSRRRDWLDVRLRHPSFDRQSDELIARIADRVLDAVLGELDADLWIGRVACTRGAEPHAAPVDAIRRPVADLKAELTDAVGKPTWTSFSGLSNGRRVTAAALVKPMPVLAPQLDRHVRVVVPFVDLGQAGEPSARALTALQDIVAGLEARLGRSALLVAHETVRSTRTLHFYVDSLTTAAEQIKAGFVGWRQGKVKCGSTPDPHWSIVGHLRR